LQLILNLQRGEGIGHLSDYQLLEKDFTVWTQLFSQQVADLLQRTPFGTAVCHALFIGKLKHHKFHPERSMSRVVLQ
jgi:hypothetical protein